MKMWPITLICFLLIFGLDAKAQEPQEFSSMPEQWQLTVDVIKAKAQILGVRHDTLQTQYQQLLGQSENLQKSIEYQQYKNDDKVRFIKEHNGHSDQDVQMAQLTGTVEPKRKRSQILDQQYADLKLKALNLVSSNQQLTQTISELEYRQKEEKERAKIVPKIIPPLVDDQLIGLRKQIEDENKQEALLANQLSDLKAGSPVDNLNVNTIEVENQKFETQLDLLRLKKLQHEKNKLDGQQLEANARIYNELKNRKYQLESSISSYESRMDDLRNASLMALSWPVKRKEIIHEMVEMDARNNQFRDQGNVLREDIDILKDQVARLERRLDFAQGKK